VRVTELLPGWRQVARWVRVLALINARKPPPERTPALPPITGGDGILADVPPTKRSILVISTSRGDARGLSQVTAALVPAESVSVRVVMTELAEPAWNPTGLEILRRVPTRIVNCGFGEAGSVERLARAAHALALAAIDRPQGALPDIVVLMGDRHELLPLAHALLLQGWPIAHVSGGEITEGVFDDAVRHALTKLSHLHLCTADQAAARILQMGEEPWRVVVTGDPTLDGLTDIATQAATSLPEALGFPLERPVAIVTYHPPTLTPELLEPELESVISSLTEVRTIVATHPGAEPHSAEILERLHRWSSSNPAVHVLSALGGLYAALLAQADVLVGNSSSGLIEAPVFCLPTVNIGDRQRGRQRAANVIDVPGRPEMVSEAVRHALDPTFRASLNGLVNPYGDGHAAERIRDVLTSVPVGGLARKRFVDAPLTPPKHD